MTNFFPAKVMLLGEYTVLNKGIAYATPFNRFSGHWEKIDSPWKAPFEVLSFLDYLSEFSWIDSVALEDDLKNNFSFPCTIPVGRGLGSSGAFSAGIYAKYGLDKKDDMKQTHHHLALIESFFHGTSSGLDPLVSYLQKPILIDKKRDSITVSKKKLNTSFYLWDSKIKRSTKSLVSWFQKELQNKIEIADINHSIRSIFYEQSQEINHLNEISKIQFEYFKPMITENIQDLWKQSLMSEEYGVKLCGAGGGGYYLIFGNPPTELRKDLIKI